MQVNFEKRLPTSMITVCGATDQMMIAKEGFREPLLISLMIDS